MGLLDVRLARVRHAVLALDELNVDFARKNGRDYVTGEEFGYVWYSGKAYDPRAFKNAWIRLRRRLKALGVRLRVKTVERQLRLWIGATDVQELIEPFVRKAKLLEARIKAKRTGDPDYEALAQELESEPISPATLRIEYEGAKNEGAKGKGFAWIRRKHCAGYKRVRRLLLISKGAIRSPTVRRTVEVSRPRALVEKALAHYRAGGSVEGVRSILKCSMRTAARFLRRNGLKVRRVGRPEGS